MPQELAIMDFQNAVSFLEDITFATAVEKNQCYRVCQNALDSKEEISSLLVDRLLAVCSRDSHDKLSNINIVLNIKSILKRIKAGDFKSLTNLLPSLLGLLHMLTTAVLVSKAETLQQLTFETIMSYPDNVLIQLAQMHPDKISEICYLYCNENLPLDIKLMGLKFLHKILQVLPSKQKTVFLKAILKVLFSRIIPLIVKFSSEGYEVQSSNPIELLEALTEELLTIDYSKDQHWQYLLECIYTPHKYPSIMKNMLESGSKIWHRLWIVFIKLLKNQITRNNSPGGSPINSMLPVVEVAFKMDVTNRCRAFECWNVLIDNFHRETNETNIVKMVKLLIVPLKSNNAKVEQTALAKLNTWWHLIRCFQKKIDKFLEPILISFLHFCFGQHSRQNKQPFVPCLLTENTKRKAVEAFIETAGHLDCTGCLDFPKLTERIITKKVLVDYWNEWVFSLKVAISMSIENIGVTHQQITCAWKSFVLIVSELPDNNVRKDLFHELLCMLETMVQYGPSDIKKTELIFNLVLSLFGNDKIKPLLKSKDEQEDPLQKVISLLMSPSLNIYYRSRPIKDIITKLKQVTNYIVDENLCIQKKLIEWIFPNFSHDSLTFLWTALSESLLDANHNVEDIDIVILWPLESHESFSDVKYSSDVWLKLLQNSFTKLDNNAKDQISSFLWSSDTTGSKLYFKLNATLVILNEALKNDIDCDKPVELLMVVTDRVDNYSQIESVCTMLTDLLASTLTNEMLMAKVKVARNAIRCVKNIIKIIIKDLQRENNVEKHAPILDNLLMQLDEFLGSTKKNHQACTTIITDELIKLLSLVKNQDTLKSHLLGTLKICLSSINEDCAPYKEIKTAIDNIESTTKSSANEIAEKKPKENKFTTPEIKKITRKAKKKEASITNTVVENGEEFVVVKSNWKFNPRKLTENQKEKLQRKREDIPALYQDLSQSQDEFKLTTWKTDSQDSSSTNSKSTSVSKSSNVEDVTNILKNIPSSDVVPKIIENIFTDNVKNDSVEESKHKIIAIDSLKPLASPKDAKSPRLALKDRVFRNVRNLIEKSGVQKDNKDLSESLTQIENVPKTPPSKVNDSSNVINSAPPKINAERPSRVKRKPKKFDDAEMIALKRNRRSLSLSDSQTETSLLNEQTLEKDLPSELVQETHGGKVQYTETNDQLKISNVVVDENLSVKDKKGIDSTKPKVKNTLTTETTIISEKVKDNTEKIKENIVRNEVELLVSTDKTVNKDSLKKTDLVTVEKVTKEKVDLNTTQNRSNETNIASECISTSESLQTPKSTKKVDSGKPKSSLLSTDKPVNKDSLMKTDLVTVEKVTKEKVDLNTNQNQSNEPIIASECISTSESLKTPKSTKKVDNGKPKSSLLSTDKPVNKDSLMKTEVVTNEKGTKENVDLNTTQNQSNETIIASECISTNESLKTPKSTKKVDNGKPKSSVKKSVGKKSRIEKELAIDTVEGHPLLTNRKSRRITQINRNALNSSRRKSMTEKLNKSKSDTPSKAHSTNSKKKDKECTLSISTGSELITVNDSPEKSQTTSDITEDYPLSEDIIESSQDSTFTTISTTSTKSSTKKLTVVLEKCPLKSLKTNESAVIGTNTQADIDLCNKPAIQQTSEVFDKADDSDFPQNRTASQKSQMDSTENMDTEPITDKTMELKDSSKDSDVILINDDDDPSIVINTEDTCLVGSETQEIAEADTQPTDPYAFVDDKITSNAVKSKDNDLNNIQVTVIENSTDQMSCQDEVNTANDVTQSICESLDIPSTEEDVDALSSPFKDEEQRKKDFLDNTLEISPIKTMSPVREKKSPSPETSSDYVVIKLTSPVQSNGEPFEKCDSPEIFTEEKISPDKRDLSPPREESSVNNNNSSPSSSLSLKKNKPQVRSGRRAAQMLGLCVPDRLQTIINNERSETEEPKRVSPSSTPARRNLRMLYSFVADNNENSEENEESEQFLKFKRSLPTSDCSPSGPILKRKLAEIADDATVTPASKRKRVSFHDPPVSTTVSVQKYIEPCGVRSPQNSALKRLERQNLRSQTTVLKSPKRLDNAFKLDSVLTKAVESFTELDRTNSEDTQSMSLDETPAVEIVKNSDLNDVDPLCPELIDCVDPIDIIASDLSSPTMKVVFLKELEGKLTTVGDLAKMTELEVNRLCIKAPKVKIAKKVLADYALRKAFEQTGPKEVTVISIDDSETPESASNVKMDVETQTTVVDSRNSEMQTVRGLCTTISVQTDKLETRHNDVQTEESGSKSTKDIITSCLAEKPDFIEILGSNLDESSKLRLADTLPFEAFKDAFMKKVSTDNTKTLITKLIEKHNVPNSHNRNGELSFLQDFMCERFASSDLILFCSELLAKIHARTS